MLEPIHDVLLDLRRLGSAPHGEIMASREHVENPQRLRQRRPCSVLILSRSVMNAGLNADAWHRNKTANRMQRQVLA